MGLWWEWVSTTVGWGCGWVCRFRLGCGNAGVSVAVAMVVGVCGGAGRGQVWGCGGLWSVDWPMELTVAFATACLFVEVGGCGWDGGCESMCCW